MSNATRWFCTRAQVKAAAGIVGAASDALIDSYIEGSSADIEKITDATFIPITETKLFRWPRRRAHAYVLELEDEDLLAVTALQTKAQDATPTTIAAADYFLEPANRTPKRRIEIDLSSSAAFESGDTPQRAISVAGRWAYSEDTETASQLGAALADAVATALQLVQGHLVEVGNTLLIESEAVFVSARDDIDSGVNTHGTTGAMTADLTDKTVTWASAPADAVAVGEVLRIGAEKMLVEAINSTSHEVKRAYDDSTLAAHSTGDDVYIQRTFTIVRGVNGTTAAAHIDDTAVAKYAPPGDIVDLCRAMALGNLAQGQSKWTGQISGGEGSVAVRQVDLYYLRERAIEKYGKVSI